MDKITSIIQLATGLDSKSSLAKGSGKNQGAKSGKNEFTQIRQFIAGVLSDIGKENTRIFVIDMEPKGAKAVVLLYTDYLRDPTMTEIEHKEYRLLGKVVRKLEAGSGETIDLLRGTGLGGMKREKLMELFGAFSNIEGMNLPEIETELQSPALEVVPIAIFV